MDDWPAVFFLVGFLSLFGLALITSALLNRQIVEPAPNRDITIHPSIWPLTLPATCFNKTGQNIRRRAFAIVLFLVATLLLDLVYIAALLLL